jgi:hypothetical protein
MSVKMMNLTLRRACDLADNNSSEQMHIMNRLSMATSVSLLLAPTLRSAANLLFDLMDTRRMFYKQAFPTGISYEKDYFSYVFGCLMVWKMYQIDLAILMESEIERLSQLRAQAAAMEGLHPWIADLIVGMLLCDDDELVPSLENEVVPAARVASVV